MSFLRSVRFALVSLLAICFATIGSTAWAAALPTPGCLYALDPAAHRSFQIAGVQSVYTACGIVVESSAADGFEMEGSETLYLQNHARVDVVGGAQLNGQTYLTDTISNVNVSAVQVTSPGDPLASIAPPTGGTIVKASPAYYDMNSKPANNTLSPGVYCGGLTIGNTNGTTFTMSPGVYIMAGGGLVFNSQANVAGTGVTIYNTSGAGWGCPNIYNYTPVTISGQVTAKLSAPTSGAFDGILFFGNRTGCATAGSCQDQIDGGSTAILNGALYFKSDQITITGSNASGYTMLVADKIYINGNSAFGDTGDPFDGITVAVSPSSSALYASQTQQFVATVSGTNPAVTWSISPSVGNVGSTGLYTAPSSIATQQTVTLTATSQADPTKFVSVPVTLYPPVAVSVSPASAVLYGGQTQQINASVTNATNTGVIWSISGAGSVSASGLYSAPASVTAVQSVVVTATSRANAAKSASSSIILEPSVFVSLSPAVATLYASQTQQFSATVANSSNASVTWTVSGPGSVSSTGLYTAPSGIASGSVATVTATSNAMPTASAKATITLEPPVTVVVSPSTSSLAAGGSQQFTASVGNASSTAVTWSISPAGAGIVSASGLYRAPAMISAAQTVTVTATSVATPSAYGSASVTLTPPVCVLNGFSFRRALKVDHTQVPNTDQTDFPMLVSGVYPFLAATGSGGDVQSASGYDVIFTSDAAGQNRLDFEIDNYNGLTGAAAFWVRVPTLSHTADTIVYMWYGNAAISTSQENKAGVWRNNYLSVYHLGDGNNLGLADSGSAGYALSGNATATEGEIGGGASFTGSPTSYLSAESVMAYPSGSSAVTLEAWFQQSPNNYGVVVGYGDQSSLASDIFVEATPYDAELAFGYSYIYADLTLAPSWHHIAAVYPGGVLDSSSNATDQIYLDGVPTATGANIYGLSTPAITTTEFKIGGLPAGTYYDYFQGSIDEVRVSAGVRSADWVSTEYNNQSAPQTFYQLQAENSVLTPSAVTLYSGQTEQFLSIPATTCPTAETWSISPAGVGTIDQSGLYTAPQSIPSRQTVTVTAASQTSTAAASIAIVTLSPPVSVTVTPATSTLFADQSVQLTASIANAANQNVVWTVSPASAGVVSPTGLYSPQGATPNGPVTVTATSAEDPSKSGSATIQVNPAVMVQVNPDFDQVRQGQSIQLTAVVTGTNNTAVTWSLLPGASGTITATGLYTAPAVVTSYNFDLAVATSQVEKTSTSIADIELVPPVNVTISPATASLYAGQTQQFTSLVLFYENTFAVNWTIAPGGVGSINGNGVYTAPAVVPTQQTVTVIGTSLDDPTKFANATVTLNPLSISVAPTSATVGGGLTQQFNATVTNNPNTSVTWQVLPAGIGSISSSGLYTAPPSVPSGQNLTVVATSQADPTKSASAPFTLVPLSISVAPTTVTLSASQTVQLSAQVVNNGNSAVNWSVAPGSLGSVSASGVYTAPATINTPATATVVATSQADPAKTANATIALSPVDCGTNGYSYQRTIVIDHTLVPNTDQINYPFLFNTTDPAFATLANGGHVTSPSGNDILFASDPSGLHRLNFELEQYNPATGQVVAWIGLPTLSHTVDTVLYVFYGNASVSAPQETPQAVWDPNYQAVYHLGSLNGTTIPDSTSYHNDAPQNNVLASNGQVDGSGLFDGATSYFEIPSVAFRAYPISVPTITDWPETFSVWFKTQSPGVIIEQTSSDAQPNGGANYYTPGLYVDTHGNLEAAFFNVSGGSIVVSQANYLDNQWHQATVNFSNGLETVFVDGQVINTTQGAQFGHSPAYSYYVGTGQTNGWPWTPGGWLYFNGSIDEVELSNTARSSDWIVTQYRNQNSPSSFYSLTPEGEEELIPSAVRLYAGQSQQFVAAGTCKSAAVWSLSAGAQGTISPTGLYTAPDTISTAQTLTVTGTTLGSTSKALTATVHLSPPVSIAVAPFDATVAAGQAQQFTASVANAGNQAVTWTMSPGNVGTLSVAGLYTAPTYVYGSQTLLVTATSVFDPTKSSTAVLTVSSTPVTVIPPTGPRCGSTGFTAQRLIVIDHTKVPNSDQVNFPFLFNSTDATLANTDSGGLVANANGWDLYFSTDPDGTTKLDHEIETYNPATGQLIAWVRIPALSHTSDTVLYLFYGNPNVTAPLANPTGVWDSNTEAVYHLANAANGVASDSTTFANNGTLTSAIPAAGEIDGAAGLSGNGYVTLSPNAFPSYPNGEYSNGGYLSTGTSTTFEATVGLWFQTASAGGLLMQAPAQFCQGYVFGFCFDYEPLVPGDYDPQGWNVMLYVNDDGYVAGAGLPTTTTTYNDSRWHYAVVSYATDGTDTLYIDGKNLGSTPGNFPTGYSNGYTYFAGTAYTLLSPLGNADWLYLNGILDEITVSDTVRSADWIQTEYNNQSSPSTFYTFAAPGTTMVVPAQTDLYALGTQQFAVSGVCSASVAWSLNSAAPGSITDSGLYTAPAIVTSAQTFSVTGADRQSGTALGTATIHLLPPPVPMALSAAVPSPYTTGTAQTFLATLSAQDGSPEPGIVVNFIVTGVNGSLGTATTDNSGVARYTYTGANAGTDSIAATAIVNGLVQKATSLSVTWTLPAQSRTTSAIQLITPPGVGMGGLLGAFTDSLGNVIEPLAIGSSPGRFVVPAGATQLQLGIDDRQYADNGGAGFTVAVNGVNVLVPATAMPWKWTLNGLNNNYQFGIGDGTDPIVAATALTPGTTILIAYQGGGVSTQSPLRPVVGASGDTSAVTGNANVGGTYYPTLYTTPSTYPQNQPLPLEALVTDSNGLPAANVPVSLTVTGANPAQNRATTDASGLAAFVYTGQNLGSDNVLAEASVDQTPLISNPGNIAWSAYPNPPPIGALALSLYGYLNDQQAYRVLATDASGNPVTNVNLAFYVTGVDNFEVDTVTDETGYATFEYLHGVAGAYNVQAVETSARNVTFSNFISGNWTVPGQTNSCGYCNSIQISVGAQTAITLPNTLLLNGTVTDNVGIAPTIIWTEVSGPGNVTFSNPSQATTSAAFSAAGNYVLEITATDAGVTATQQVSVAVNPAPVTRVQVQQGFLGSPLYGASVNGLVPITVAGGTSLVSGVLSYDPTTDTSQANPVVLNAQVSGSGQIGTLDTTLLKNGSYWIQLQATDSAGHSQYSLVLVTVTGNYKPGRVTASVTDLVVPATGLSINLQRNYDSLNAATSGDFGYGWNLSTNVDLTVGPASDVTFTLGGQRRTFFFTPGILPDPGFTIFYETFAGYSAEPGLGGTLTAQQDEANCPLGVVERDGSLWLCSTGAIYSPLGYTYTDPNGTQYSISASGALNSITDIGGNSLTVTPAGIASSTGLSVPFLRDANNRITQITDPQGNRYRYTYDASGNLATVTYPSVAQPSTYTYTAGHLYNGGTDFRTNPLPTANYTPDGRLQSVTDALGQTTSYVYDLTGQTTTTTNPPDAGGNVGTSTVAYDSYGMALSSTDPLGLITTRTYDANHNLASVTDPLGHVSSYTYDPNGNKTSSTYPKTATSTNTTSTSTYNQYSEPTSTTDELGNVRTLNYDANYWPQSITDGLGPVASFTFNSNGTMSAGALGFDLMQSPTAAAQFTFDSDGNRLSQTDALGRTTSFTYDSLGHKLTMTTPQPGGASATGASQVHSFGVSKSKAGQASARANSSSSTTASPTTTTYSYNALGLLIQSVGPLGQTQSYQYDQNGNEISYTDPLGNVTGYQYDALNRLTLTTFPTSPITASSRSYDFRSNLIDYIDQAGHDTHRAYDVSGRLTSISYGYGTPTASTTTYTYYNDGKKQSETDALGNATDYTYDAAGHLLAIAGARGNASWTYDDAGNRITYTDGNGNVTSYQYDARKRVTKTTHPDSTSASYTYDGQGHVASVTDENGNAVQYLHDATGQLSSVVQSAHPNPAHNTNTYGYDNLANLNLQTDENGHSTSGNYDLLSDLTNVTLPDGTQTESATYDLAGDVLTWQHFNGATTSYTYDSQYRLLTKTPDPSTGEPTVTFTYTPNGLPRTMSDGSGTTTYSYDALDRLTSKATPEGALSYGYDANGLLTSTTSSNANGISVTYAYDNQNRLTGVTDNRLPAGQNTTTYTYDGSSYVVTATYPNGLQSALTWDSRHRLTDLANPVATYSYALDPVGNRTSATENNGRTITWNYDGIYRLSNETVAQDPAGQNGSVSYNLDPVGNRLAATSSLPGVASSTASYTADDLLSTETYDLNGNVLSSGGKSFAYDSDNRLTSMNGNAVQLLYDGWGNRVARTADGVTTRYLVDDLNPTGYPQVVEELVNGAVTRQYSYGFQRISENQLVSSQGNGSAWTPSFYGYDGLGSVRQLTSLAGAITDTYAYDAFGNLLNSTGTTLNDLRYQGEQYDQALGLQYLRARYYNPATGRFMSKDPYSGDIADPKTLQRYTYVGDNPLRYADPSGRETTEVVLADGETQAEKAPVALTGAAVDCILETSAQVLLAVAFDQLDYGNIALIAIEAATCGAEAFSKPHEPVEPGNPGEASPPHEEPESPPCGLCFAAGTPVHTQEGDIPIEKIVIGEKVLSRNLITGALEYEPVTALTPAHQDSLLDLRIEGETTTLRPTASHPFWVRRGDAVGQWMDAGAMRVGDLVQTIAGQWRQVAAVTPERHAQTVYNFTVDQNHDYFVGDVGYLVHNEGDCGCEPGEFSILDWSDYPPGLPQPPGPFRLLSGGEYDTARAAANSANDALHAANPGWAGMDIHEIHPVKFGGRPTDPLNKTPLSRCDHSKYTTWWRMIQRSIE